jgi:hypothetical protein
MPAILASRRVPALLALGATPILIKSPSFSDVIKLVVTRIQDVLLNVDADEVDEALNAAFAELSLGDAETKELKDSVGLDVGRDESLTVEEKDKLHVAAVKLGVRKDILDYPTGLYELLQCSSAKAVTQLAIEKWFEE